MLQTASNYIKCCVALRFSNEYSVFYNCFTCYMYSQSHNPLVDIFSVIFCEELYVIGYNSV
jgi:hypothetical protein